MAEVPVNLDEWQLRLDQDYPAGAVVRLPSAGTDGTVFHTTGLTVVGLEEGEPVVRFWAAGVDKDFVVRVKEYETVRINPVKVVRVVTGEENQIFLLGGGLTPDNVPEGWMEVRRAERDTALEFSR